MFTGIYGVPIGFFLQYLWKRAGLLESQETLYSSKRKFLYVVGKPCNIYRLWGKPYDNYRYCKENLREPCKSPLNICSAHLGSTGRLRQALYHQIYVHSLMPYPCSHFYVDINFGKRLYLKENRPDSPLFFLI